jgi:hypothetical protein
MKKTKNISKYDLDWQIVRASVKGSKMDVYTKLDHVINFYNSHISKENHERVLNWLEGLALGYKKRTTKYMREAFSEVMNLLTVYNSIDVTGLKSIESTNDYSKYTFEQRYTLWVDLFKRTKAWARKGYVHQEQLEFCEQLWNSFTDEEKDNVFMYYSKENFDEMISRGRKLPNTHKFLF